jgi:hypothetical protein
MHKGVVTDSHHGNQIILGVAFMPLSEFRIAMVTTSWSFQLQQKS